jgi:hypothetical protein
MIYIPDYDTSSELANGVASEKAKSSLDSFARRLSIFANWDGVYFTGMDFVYIFL